MGKTDRSHLNFEEKVRKAFAFLIEEGFYEVEASPMLVRYRKDGVEVDVYHGRQSYEIGAGVTAFGSRYTLSEIIRANDPETGKHFSYSASTTPDGVVDGLEKLSSFMKCYGCSALNGERQFFSMLQHKRKLWAEEYALDVLAQQIRPQADDAFRQGNYSKAADLYSRIIKRLSPTEVKKLSLAEERRDKALRDPGA